jgi:hypothetical protein
MNWVTTTGHTVETPRYVVSYMNSHHGRRFSVLDTREGSVVARGRLSATQKVVPALAQAGFTLAGKWKGRADGSSCAVVVMV